MTEAEKIEAAIKVTEYKYFGDYEMSDDQREAVDTLVAFARHKISAGDVGLRERSVAEEWDCYMNDAVNNAPEPLRKLGEFLSDLLYEDQWKTAERYLNAAVLASKETPLYAHPPAQAPTDAEAMREACAKVAENTAWEMTIANEAVGLNLDSDGNPKYQSAQGYACALSAVRLTLQSLPTRPGVSRMRIYETVRNWLSKSDAELAADAIMALIGEGK